jgi:hypothetical protein
MDGISAERTFKLVSSEISGEFASLLMQLQRKGDRSPVKISRNDPSSRDSRIHGTRRLGVLRRRVLCQQNSREKKQQD